MSNPNYVVGVYNELTNQRFSMEDVETGKLKGRYIPEERKVLEQTCGVESVNEVFGPPTHLEDVEAMLLEYEDLDRKEIKYAYLIEISYEISNACCKELNSDSPIRNKYAYLYTKIPVQVARYSETLSFFPDVEVKKESVYVTADQLKTAKNLLKMEECSPAKKMYLDYIFGLVYISLKEIFEEVKNEIMDQ